MRSKKKSMIPSSVTNQEQHLDDFLLDPNENALSVMGHTPDEHYKRPTRA
jgi:hypothetical protein